MATEPGALVLTGVTIHYPGTPAPAVAGVSLNLAAGEILALLGPSGCGKSSLLRAIAGLEAYTGHVSWQDHDLVGVAVHQRGFGLMFQEGQLFPHRTVGGNIAYGLQMAGMARAQRAERVNELLKLVGLAGYAGRRVNTLSGGEQQRVALARALAPQPQLLLLDEPLSALDRSLREALAQDLRRILQATGTTALYVTHDQDEAFTVADHIALMRRGVIVQEGSPAEIWSAPLDSEVAQFLGYRLVAGGALALGPRAVHVAVPLDSRAGASDLGAPTARLNSRAATQFSDPTTQFSDPTQAEPLFGVVRSMKVVRGEMIAEVEIPSWGLLPAITTQSVVVGEQVPLRLQADQVVRFDAPAPDLFHVPVP